MQLVYTKLLYPEKPLIVYLPQIYIPLSQNLDCPNNIPSLNLNNTPQKISNHKPLGPNQPTQNFNN